MFMAENHMLACPWQSRACPHSPPSLTSTFFFPIFISLTACTRAAERRQMHYAAHNRTVTFLPENDMMGHMFDSHGGLVQTMTCNTDHLGPVGCHLLEITICNLISHCGEREHVHE